MQTIRKEYEILYKQNQDLKLKVQKLENYNGRQQMIEYSKNALKKFPKPQKRKRKHEQIYGSSSSSSSEKENRYYIYPSKANLKKAKKSKKKESNIQKKILQ